MTREQAAILTRNELDKHGLSDWHVRISGSLTLMSCLGLCSYKDKAIIINAHHVEMHPDDAVINTIKHEVAHALCPNNGHDEVWAAKAREIGCENTESCSNLSLDPLIIDAIRSGADVKVDFEKQVIYKPKYEVTRIQDKCPYCQKVAVTKKETLVTSETQPDLKIINLECGHTIVKTIPKGTPFHTLITNARYHADCKHQFEKNQCVNCKQFRPFQFQVEGMRFIEQALAIQQGVGIFDEMGLGKTIQSIGYLKFHPEDLPALFIVKSALKFQWSKAIVQWMGDEFVPQVIEKSSDNLIPGLKCYIISYDMMVFKIRKNKAGKEIKQGFDITKFDKAGIRTVVMDECQQIKNTDSSRTQQVRKIIKTNKKVIALSGTPWKNKGGEFFSVLNMLAPMKFSSEMNFLRRWVTFYESGQYVKQGGIKNVEQFKEYVKDIIIRRERTEVMKELPLINRMRLYIKLDDIEQETYDNETSEFVKWYNDKIVGGEDFNSFGSDNILAKLSRMRHVTGLAKIPATIEFVKTFVEETDRKLCIFVHHKDVGSLIYEELVKEFGNIMPVLKLTGEQAGIERFNVQEKFNESPRCLLVASTLAAGEGLNLQTGADCILHERQWNPANEEQAEGRFIRIGQTATSVNATYTLGEGTIDDFFDQLVEAKRSQFHAAMNNSVAPQWNQTDIVKELAEMIVKKFKDKKKKK